jgi:hypothetical protein
LAAALPEHSVFVSGGDRESTWISVMPVVARARVLGHAALVRTAMAAYRSACSSLTAGRIAGKLGPEWSADEHGGHCRFVSRSTGQVVEAPLRPAAEPLDPYFFAEFLLSTPGYESLAELIAHKFHDTARILEIMDSSGRM